MLKTNYKNRKKEKKVKFVFLQRKKVKVKKINVLMVGPEISYNLDIKFNAF